MTAQAGEPQEAWVQADDAALLELARAGDPAAYGELWRRHLPAAYGVAHRYRNRASAEDIVAEAAARVYALIKAGKGPQTNFRSYFLSTVRTAATDTARSDLRVIPTEGADLEVMAGSTEAHDPTRSVDHEMVRAAFQALPERDQRVLWFTTVEGESPSKVASALGMSANGVSVTALRAKDTLRARYLDAHATRAISRAEDDECRWVLSQMGRFVRGKLPARQKARVEEHLRSCRHAQGLAYEMADVSRGLPAIIVPLIFMSSIAAKAAWVAVPAILAAAGPDPLGAVAGQHVGTAQPVAAAQPTTAASPSGGGQAAPSGPQTSVLALAGSSAAMIALAIAAAASVVVVAVTQLPKILGNDAPPQSGPVIVAPTTSSPPTSPETRPTSPSPTVSPPAVSPTAVAPVYTPPAPTRPGPTSPAPTRPSATSPASSTAPSPTTSSVSTSTTSQPSTTSTTSTSTTPTTPTTTPPVVEPTVQVGAVVRTGAGNGVRFPVTVDPGTATGEFTVRLRSTATASLSASGSGWACSPATAPLDAPLLCTTTVNPPAGVGAGVTAASIELQVDADGDLVGPVEVTVSVDGVTKATDQVQLTAIDPVLSAVQRTLPDGTAVFEAGFPAGRLTQPPVIWVWWVDDSGSVSRPTADTRDDWSCQPAASGQPSGVPQIANKCVFARDPRTLTPVRHMTTLTDHHVVHIVMDVGGVTTEKLIDYAPVIGVRSTAGQTP